MDSKHVYLVFILGTMIFIMFAIALIMFLVYYKRKQQLHLAEKLNLEHQYQSQLLQTRLEVQEQAFKYLSEEIHDNVGQALSMVKLQLYSLNQLCRDESKPLIESTSEVLSKAINDLRNISHNLHGGYVSDHGLQEALQKEVNYINGAKAVNAELDIEGNPYFLSREKELLIFRIIQEAVNNAIKHANASLITVRLIYYPLLFTAVIHDNGSGFDIRQYGASMGLNNMKTRAAILGAGFEILSEEMGTHIILRLNLQENGPQN
ncbi:MAG TPA: histidine kinase [Flavipsychrobacter sp.]|nr:histidine kinase [Flavipsychrobacter sp.]